MSHLELSTYKVMCNSIEKSVQDKLYVVMSTEEISEINKRLIDTLKVFDSICRENGLSYLLVAGGLIGAVRNGKCIPWDDDLDIVMPRPDYMAFSKVLNNSKYKDKYVWNYPEDGNVITMCAHFYNPKDKLSDIINDKIGQSRIYEDYAYLDVSPLDSCSNNKLLNIIKGLLVNFVQISYISKRCFKRIDPFLNYLSKKSISLRANLFIRKIVSMPLLFIPKKMVFKLLDSLLRYDNSSENMTISFGGKRYFGEALPREVWFPIREVSLDGVSVMAPNDCHCYLTKRYGNYLMVPSEKEQEERRRRLRSDWEKIIQGELE